MSGGGNQNEPAITLMVAVAAFAVIGYIIWYHTRGWWLDHFFRWLRFGELWTLNLVMRSYGPCLDWLREARVNDVNPSMRMITLTNACFGSAYLAKLSPAQLSDYYALSMPPILAIGGIVTFFIRWPAAAFLAWVGYYELFQSPRNKFLTKHTLETFIQAQVKMWPVISPITRFNPAKTGRILGNEIPDKLPLFAEALSPEEWVSWCRIPVVNGIPDRDAARRAFIQQLGPRWTGIESCPPHIKAVFAAFALKGAQKRDESDDILGRIALCWTPGKGLRLTHALAAEIDKIVHDPDLGGKAAKIADTHAWRTTAVLSVLKWARLQGGVLAPAQFVWMRAEDRALWYPMNNLGRRSFHSEGAGAMAHFMAEENAKKPLPIPRVETAIVTLNTYLHDPDKRTVAIPPREGGAKA